MDAKITFKLNDSVMECAKKYAEKSDDFEISPFVKSIASGNSIPTSYDHKNAKADYLDFLDKKYQ